MVAAELPATPGRAIYDLKRAAELVGGDLGDAIALIEDAVSAASAYARTIAVSYRRGAAFEPPPDKALFDHRLRTLIELVSTAAHQKAQVVVLGLSAEAVPSCVKEADVATGVLLSHDRGSEFRRGELERWAKAVGLLQPAAAGAHGHVQRRLSTQERREEVLAVFLRATPEAQRPRTVKAYHDALQELDRRLFTPSHATFEAFWRRQKLVKFGG